MDKAHKIDGHPAIGLRMDVRGKKGWLRLSPVYGSYKVESEFPIAKDALVRMSCPHCQTALRSSTECEICGASMVPMLLEEGGKVFICSRKGCKKHFLEFEDVNKALTKFYDTYALGGGRQQTLPGAAKPALAEPDAKEVICSGSFLQAYCPHCKQTMIDHSSLTFVVEGRSGKEGLLLLSPYLNVFTNRSTIEIPHGEEVRDLRCPHCNRSLMEKLKRCDRCESRIAKITVGAMHKLITFFICLRKGCTWHGISGEDTKLIMLEDSQEW
jgi:ssDNA-binding Zn-finger/Zn-ribbon topoisomerase 1